MFARYMQELVYDLYIIYMCPGVVTVVSRVVYVAPQMVHIRLQNNLTPPDSFTGVEKEHFLTSSWYVFILIAIMQK